MTEVTSPIILDETGQSMVSSLTKLNIDFNGVKIYYKDFVVPKVNISAGDACSRAYQYKIDCTPEEFGSSAFPFLASIIYIDYSTNAIIVPFISGKTLYVNFYRALTTATSVNTKVRVIYAIR